MHIADNSTKSTYLSKMDIRLESWEICSNSKCYVELSSSGSGSTSTSTSTSNVKTKDESWQKSFFKYLKEKFKDALHDILFLAS